MGDEEEREENEENRTNQLTTPLGIGHIVKTEKGNVGGG